MPSRARIAGNRIGGTLRQNPDADVTVLRRGLDWAVALDRIAAAVAAWGPPTDEELADVEAVCGRTAQAAS